MKVKELIKKLQECDLEGEMKIAQGEELECCPEWWDGTLNDGCGDVAGEATKMYSEDIHSHEMYLLVIKDGTFMYHC